MKIMNSFENSNIHELIFCHHCPHRKKMRFCFSKIMFLALSFNPLYWVISCS